MNKEDIPPHVGLIMGCLLKAGKPMLPSDFMRLHRDRFIDLPSPFPNPEDVGEGARAVAHFDIGMRQGEEAGVIETFRDAGLTKWVRLTDLGISMVQQ